jgi:hypothetical protein
MKKLHKNLLYAALSTLLCSFLAAPAHAQRGSTGRSSSSNSGGSRSSGSSGGSFSGGGGGVRSSGGSTSYARPSGGGGSYARSSGGGAGSVGVSRPGFNPGPPRQGVVNGQGGVRGNYGYAPRQGTLTNGFAPRQGTLAGNNYVTRLGVTPRGPTSGGLTAGYRTAPQIGYGRGYFGRHGYYHYAHGYYGTYYLPSLGFTCGYLPYGYYPFYFGDDEFFFSNGLFYQYDNSVYTVVEPPVGAEVKTLPDNAQSIVINGQQYYELNGVYYQPVTKDDGTVVYQVAGKDGELNTQSNIDDNQPQPPQMGDIVLQLPQDCRKIKVNGQKLWVSPDGIYYQELTDANHNKTYKIVGLPSDETDQN